MKKFQYLIILLIVAFFCSCGNYKRFTYLQLPPQKNDSIFQANLTDYKLQPADILYLNVSNLNKDVTASFNQDISVNATALGNSVGSGLYLTGNSIDREGNIILPIIGKVHVAGFTLEEAKQNIQKLAETYMKDVLINVKLISFKISLIGEFIRPGQYTIFSDKANIFEAISMAGDISYNGNRRNVYIMRTYNNKTRVIKLDLTKRDILSSDLYYLQPNDIVYVEPLRSTAFRLRINDYSVFLTLITTTITATLLIKNFNK